MSIRGITPILNVASIPKSFEWFESLGWRRGFAWGDDGLIKGAASTDAKGDAHFGSVLAGDQGEFQIFLCCRGQGSRGTIMPRWPGDDMTDGVWMSWWIDSISALDALHIKAVELGYIVTMPPTNEPWGVREFHLRHPDGHMFRVSTFTQS